MRPHRRLLRGPTLAHPPARWPIRPGQDADAAAFIALIGRCWADYPGCILDVDAEAPELRRLASYFTGQGGALFVAGDGALSVTGDGALSVAGDSAISVAADLVGMIACRPLAAAAWEICKVYVHPGHHGSGLGGALMDVAEAFALDHGAQRLLLWTDTRFARAHRFYQKRGYTRGQQRALLDLSQTREWLYCRNP